MKTKTRWLAAVVGLGSTSALLAHHSLGNYDTSTAVHIKGTVVEFQRINPHSILFVDEKGPDGQTHRWAVEGPPVLQLNRKGFAEDALKPGAVVEICGYAPKEKIVWQIASGDPSKNSTAGRLINAETLVTPDGKQQSWGDYGVHKCFAPGYTDQHSQK